VWDVLMAVGRCIQPLTNHQYLQWIRPLILATMHCKPVVFTVGKLGQPDDFSKFSEQQR
jgi:hypothetical protein